MPGSSRRCAARRLDMIDQQLAHGRERGLGNASASGMTVRKLHPVLGAQVDGVDLKKPLSAEQVREINRAWAVAGNGVLIFKRQHLTEAELKTFAARFGHVMAHPFQNNTNKQHNKGNAAFRGTPAGDALPMEVMTVRDRSDTWHTDMTWMEHPPRATFLQCVERGADMESGGEGGGSRGDTAVCSMTNTYDMLSPGLQQVLQGMTCRHSVRDLMAAYKEGDVEEKRYPNGVITTAIENEHPAVIVHPISGRRSMYVNNWPCKRFTGMTSEETAPLKRYLNEVATREQNVYRHSWSVGDLMLIDQRVTMHYVFPDYDLKKQVRVMQRTTITDVGDAPGVTGFPRPVGVTGKTGPEMATVPDRGGTPKSFRANPTMLPGSYSRRGARPFSDRVWDGMVGRGGDGTRYD